MTDIENSAKKTLKESAVTECGPMPDSAPMNPGNPVTMSVTLNASGKDHVNDLLMMMKAAGLDKAEVQPPSLPMRQDMDRLGAIMRDAEFDQEERDYSNPEPEYYDELPQSTGGINGPKKMFKPAAKGDNPMSVEADGVSDADRNPSIERSKYKSHSPVSKKKYDQDGMDRRDNEKGLPMDDMSIAKRKKEREMFGDSLDVKEFIKSRLLQALSEKKAKPDFLDMDKDGNKKEPMKKALKDKKKNPFKK